MDTKTTGITLAAGIALTGLVGCHSSNKWPPKYHTTRTLVLPAEAGEVSVSADSPFGDLHVAAHEHETPIFKDANQTFPLAASGEVALLAVVRSDIEDRLDHVELNPHWIGDTLVLDVDWPDGKRRKSEGADWIVRVPTVGSVSGSYNFGDLTILHPQGNVDLDADFGDIVVVSPLGEIDIASDFGNVDITNARGIVEIRSDFGDIDLTLTDDNPGPVYLQADFGDIDFTAGPAFTGEIAMDTDFGSSRMTEIGDRTHTMKSSGNVRRNQGEGPKSKISTDFGDVNVKIRE